MAGAKESSKTAKKEAKTRAKLEKKLARAGTQAATDSRSSPTPAERSAAAAERQVILQKYRVWLAATVAVMAIVTFLATVKPWNFFHPPPHPKAADRPG